MEAGVPTDAKVHDWLVKRVHFHRHFTPPAPSSLLAAARLGGSIHGLLAQDGSTWSRAGSPR
jgi:hypothetical protein